MTGRDDDSFSGQPPPPAEVTEDLLDPDQGVGIGADEGSSFEPEEDPEVAADTDQGGSPG